MRRVELMRPPMAGELGLTDEEKLVLDIAFEDAPLLDNLSDQAGQLGFQISQLQTIISSLIGKNLIGLYHASDVDGNAAIVAQAQALEHATEHPIQNQETSDICVRVTDEGARLVRTLLRAGDCVVYFHKIAQLSGEANILPIIAVVEDTVLIDEPAVPLRFFTPELSHDSRLIAVHMNTVLVAPHLLMRVVDFCAHSPAVYPDDAQFLFEHELGVIDSHNPRTSA